MAEQYHLRTDDSMLIDAIAHEQRRAGLSKSAVMLELVRAGLEQMRWRREHEAFMVYKIAQEVEQNEGEAHG